MASTNKTTNYELSQFLGTDKPAWLSDYNTDMSKIDAQMKLNADGVTSATGASTTNASAIGTLANLTTDAKTNLVLAVNEVDSHADTAQNTANSASTNATTALNKAELALSNTTLLNLTNFASISASSFTNITNFTSMGGSISVATNSDGTVFKLYGSITFNKQFGSSSFKFASAIRPEESITISPVGFLVENGGYIRNISATIATDGVVTISVYGDAINSSDAIFFPCLYFGKDFGDTPVNS